MLDWINTNANAVVAIGTLVTAIATAVLAVLTISTYALFRLEKSRERAKRGHVAAHLVRLRQHYRTSADLLEQVAVRDPVMTGMGKAAAKLIREENRARRAHIESLFPAAAGSPMEVMASLDAALTLTTGVEGLLDDILASGGGKDSEERRKQAVIELRDLESILKRGYEALPRRDRRWHGGNKDYDEVVHEFLGPTRKRLQAGASSG